VIINEIPNVKWKQDAANNEVTKKSFISAYEAGVDVTRYCVCGAVLQVSYDFRLTDTVGYTVK
jgi:hypothetical protein